MTTKRLRWRTGALCVCGCGRRCGHRRNRYATPHCVPRGDRSAWASRGRRRSLLKFRMQKFRLEAQQLMAEGGRITVEDLMAAFATVWDRGYHAALTRERSERKRTREKETAA